MAFLDRLAVQLDDDVAVVQSGLGAGRAAEYLRNQYAAFILDPQPVSQFGVIEVLDLDAKIAAVFRAVLEKLLHDVVGQVAGDGQADALPAAAAALDGGIDADHLSLEVDERSATVARI